MKDSLKLLHVVPTYLPATRYGGPIYAAHGLCRALAAAGHDVSVCTTNVDGPGESGVALGESVNMDGVNVTYFPSRLIRRLYWSPNMLAHLKRSVPHVDFVHLHSVFLWPTWAAARVSRAAEIPYAISPRGMLVKDLIDERSTIVKRLWLTLIERRNISSAAFVHSTTDLEAREIERLGLRPRSMVIIPNGVEFSVGARRGRHADVSDVNRPYFLFLGRLNWKKGIEVAVSAMTEVIGADLIVAGHDEDGYRARLERLVAEKGVSDRVRFFGAVAGERKDELLAKAAGLVLPSISENFANVVVEAMAVGCPVIVSPGVGLAGTVLATGSGFVVKREGGEFAAAMNRLLHEGGIRAAMGEAGRRAARDRFTWGGVAAAMVDAYRSVVESGCSQTEAA